MRPLPWVEAPTPTELRLARTRRKRADQADFKAARDKGLRLRHAIKLKRLHQEKS